MGFFSNLLKDFSDAGTPLGELRKEIASLTNLLANYSYGDNNLSLDMMRVSTANTLSKIQQNAQKCSQNDIMRLYGNKIDFEIPVYLAVTVAKYYIEAVLDNNFKFTASLQMHMTKRAETDYKYKNGVRINDKPLLSDIFWNFVFLMDVAIPVDNVGVYRSIDTLTKLEYRLPIVTDRIVKGYIIFSIEGEFQNSFSTFELLGNIISNKGQNISLKKRPLMGHGSVSQYESYIEYFMEQIIDDERFMLIALKGEF
jgi:hypothetical protein